MRKKVQCRSLSSIHILYHQALVGGLSDSSDPARRIVNLSLDGGSTAQSTLRKVLGWWCGPLYRRSVLAILAKD